MELYVKYPAVRERELLDRFTAIKRVEDLDNELAEEFAYFWLWHRKPIVKATDINNILILMKNFNFDFEYLENTFKRLSAINRELDRFLHNPVINCSPVIIDIDRYKKCNHKRTIINSEQGYYKVMDVFTGYTVVLKKLNTGRFIRLNMDRDIIKYLKIDDIMNILVSQNLFLGWDLIHVYGYYPKEAAKFIR